MRRTEKLIIVRDTHEAIVEALDAILHQDGYDRIALRSIREDFSSLLQEEGGPLAFVLAPPQNEWVGCWSSLSVTAEWDVAEALAGGLEQPIVYALFDAQRDLYLYRYFEEGELREEALPQTAEILALDEAALLDKLAAYGIGVELIDDRLAGFAQEHLVVGYARRSIQPT